MQTCKYASQRTNYLFLGIHHFKYDVLALFFLTLCRRSVCDFYSHPVWREHLLLQCQGPLEPCRQEVAQRGEGLQLRLEAVLQQQSRRTLHAGKTPATPCWSSQTKRKRVQELEKKNKKIKKHGAFRPTLRLCGTIQTRLAVEWPTAPSLNTSTTTCASTAQREYTNPLE